MVKITDNQEEVFDIVDKRDNVIGRSTRGEVHKDKNLLHRSIGVFIFNEKGELFLQKRSLTKDTDPGKWTISCSGHVGKKVKNQKSKVKNNIYEETAHRELKEELGVDLEIQEITKFICYALHETEMCVLFKAHSEGPFKLLKEEISEGKFITQKELIEALKEEKIELSFMGKRSLEIIGWL